MKRIAVLTSGGDAPGMNAAIRAIVRSGIMRGWEVYGVQHGYKGLINGDLQPMGPRTVSGIIQRGGTVLGSARCPEFRTEEGRMRALRELRQHEIEALIIIGGNGSQTGAHALSQMGFPVVGVASTIDNDLYGAEITIGVDTALNIALEAIDRLKVTASSHARAFLIEVMGRDCGYLALVSGIAGGAEAIVIPEQEITPEQIAGQIREAYANGKEHAIIIVAEGAKNNADKLSAYFAQHEAALGFDLRVSRLGYIQRGGAPGAFDRFLGTRSGAAAVKCIEREMYGVLVGLQQGAITTTPLDEVVTHKKEIDTSLLELAAELV